MPINRKPKMKNYTTVDNYFINDINLKPEQKGYLLFMLSKPDEWNFNYSHLTKALGVGEKALRSNIKKLEALHYLKRERLRDKNGKNGFTFGMNNLTIWSVILRIYHMALQDIWRKDMP